MNASPFAIVPSWLKDFRAIAVALIADDGRIVEANEGFLMTLAGITEGFSTSNFIEPSFNLLCHSPPQADGLIYHGLLTLGAPEGARRSFSGRVYRMNQMLFVAAEMDISAFEQMNDEIGKLKKELDDVRRQLSKRNHALQSALEEMTEIKRHDPTTGLANRVILDQRMEEEIKRWERSRRPLALMLMDMDGFTKINADYGREVGDEVLKHVATVVMQAVRSVDVAVRYGGQEFAILLPETNEMGALIVAERLRMDLEGQIMLPVLEPATASFGVAIYLSGEQREELYARAWRALKHAKAHGKNAITMAGVVGECDHLYQSGSPQSLDVE
ncbi:MAG: diguanylate cyclase [Hydrogenophilales bacterium]|nr:diguanylate cyclase [Hydrogenophilales bacterium]